MITCTDLARANVLARWLKDGVPVVGPDGRFVRDESGNMVRVPPSAEIVEEARLLTERMKTEKVEPRVPGDGDDDQEDNDDA